MEAKPHWWRTGYGRLTAVLGLIAVVFAVAQLPVQLAGFPQTVKDSMNVIEDLFASKRTVVSASRIGKHDVSSLSLAGAVSAFGDPESRERHGFNCTLRWSSQGLEIVFVATTGHTCDPNESLFCVARLTTHRWQTSAGLHVGDSVEKLHALYPGAERVGEPRFDQEWALDIGTLGCPLFSPAIAGLRAETIGETVNQLEIYHFNAGE